MATLRTLNIDLRAGTARLAQDFQRANSIVGQFQREARDSFAGVTKAAFSMQSAITALVGVGGLGALVKSSMASADALAKSADKIGVTTQALAGLQHMAGLAGVGTSQLDSSLKTMQKNIGDFASGTGRAAVALQALGFSESQLIRMSADEQFAAIADAMNDVKTSAERTNYAMKIFGDSGSELINVMAEGSAGMRAAAAEAEQLGLAISRVDAAKIELANDAFTRAQAAIRGAGNTIAVELAPYLQVAAEQFVALVRENNGFRDEIIAGFEAGTKAVAFFGDTVRGLHVVYKGAEVVAVGFVAATLTALDELNKATAAAMNLLTAAAKGPAVAMLEAAGQFSDSANAMAGDLRDLGRITPSPQLSEWAAGMRGALMDTRAELAALVMTPMPSEGIEQWFAAIKAKAEEAAAAIASSKAGMFGGNQNAGITSTITPAIDSLPEPNTDALQSRLESVREYLFTEEEAIANSYAMRAEIVGNALQAQLVTESDARNTLLQLESDYTSRIASVRSKGLTDLQRFNAMSWKAQTATVAGEMVAMTAQVATQNRAMFEINKVGAIASAIINTHQGVTRTLAEYPQPLAGILAAGHLAAGLAQVSAIRSASFGGGGGGGGGAVPTFPANPVTALPEPATREQDLRTSQARTINVTIQGDQDGLVSMEWVRDRFVPHLNDALDDGVELRIAR